MSVSDFLDRVEADVQRDAKQKEIDTLPEKYRNRLDDERKSNEALRINVRKLEDYIEQLQGRILYEQSATRYYYDGMRRIMAALDSAEEEIAYLKRPLWVKIVGWFAR